MLHEYGELILSRKLSDVKEENKNNKCIQNHESYLRNIYMSIILYVSLSEESVRLKHDLLPLACMSCMAFKQHFITSSLDKKSD